jgi:hypothetical protein
MRFLLASYVTALIGYFAARFLKQLTRLPPNTRRSGGSHRQAGPI